MSRREHPYKKQRIDQLTGVGAQAAVAAVAAVAAMGGAGAGYEETVVPGMTFDGEYTGPVEVSGSKRRSPYLPQDGSIKRLRTYTDRTAWDPIPEDRFYGTARGALGPIGSGRRGGDRTRRTKRSFYRPYYRGRKRYRRRWRPYHYPPWYY